MFFHISVREMCGQGWKAPKESHAVRMSSPRANRLTLNTLAVGADEQAYELVNMPTWPYSGITD